MEKVERYQGEPRKPAKPKKQFSEDDIKKAQEILPTISGISVIAELRAIWLASSDFLDAPVEGTTLKDVINKRVEELSL